MTQAACGSSELLLEALDRDLEHLDGLDGVVPDGLDLGDLGGDVHALDDLAEHRMLGLACVSPRAVSLHEPGAKALGGTACPGDRPYMAILPGENQSRLALLATLMKNCEPPAKQTPAHA